MEIRYVLQSDYSEILEMEKENFSFPHSLEQLRAQEILVAYADEVLGYVGIKKVEDEGYISNICVKGNHRREGIADALLWKLIDEYNELSFITLECRASNEAAVSLYKKHGFDIVGKMSNYYIDPKEDALIMTLRFQRENTGI